MSLAPQGRTLRPTADGQPEPLQYRDGANLYEYVRSEPVRGLDPSGLDRYISRDGLHGYFVIDEWDKDCCKVTGYWRVDFVPNAGMKITDFGYWFNLAAAITIGGGAHINVDWQKSKPASISTTIKSTCKGDKKLLKELKQMSFTKGNEDFYWSAYWRNCWVFTWEWAYKYDDE